MSNEESLWLTFILVGLATTLPRASFIILGNRVELPTAVQRALRYAPAAALAAIIVPDLLVTGGTLQLLNPKLAAAIAAAVATLVWRNPWVPFIAGMGLLLLLRNGLGL